MELSLQKAQSKSYEDNLERYGDHSDTCLICGKRTKNDEQTKMVHLLTNGNLTTEEEHEESQGAFPIGGGCAARLKKQFKF